MLAHRNIQKIVILLLLAIISVPLQSCLHIGLTKPVVIKKEKVSSNTSDSINYDIKLDDNLQHQAIEIRISGETITKEITIDEFKITSEAIGDYYPVDDHGSEITWTKYWVNVVILGLPTLGLIWVQTIVDWTSLPFRLPDKKTIIETETKEYISGQREKPINISDIAMSISHPSFHNSNKLIVEKSNENSLYKINLRDMLKSTNYELDKYRVHIYNKSSQQIAHSDLSLLKYENKSSLIKSHLKEQQLQLLNDIEKSLNDISSSEWERTEDAATAYYIMINIVKVIFLSYLRPETEEMHRLKDALNIWVKTSNINNVYSSTGKVLIELQSAKRSLITK